VFKAGLIATILGVGISISTAASFKKFDEHRRVKKTFGYLKLITIPYIVNQSDNLSDTLKQYNDIVSVNEALIFTILVSNFDAISRTFDKSWLQLVYSQEFIDAIKSDEQFQKISDAVKEVLLFTKSLTAQSVIAKNLTIVDPNTFTSKDQKEYLKKVRMIRDELKESICTLNIYTKNLENEIDTHLSKNGAKYSETDRP
jgi:Zn-dependent oligopeptidase